MSDSIPAYSSLVDLVEKARYLTRNGEVEPELVEFNTSLHTNIPEYFPPGTKFSGKGSQESVVLPGKNRVAVGTTLLSNLVEMSKLANKKIKDAPKDIGVAYANLGYAIEAAGSKILALEAIKRMYHALLN